LHTLLCTQEKNQNRSDNFIYKKIKTLFLYLFCFYHPATKAPSFWLLPFDFQRYDHPQAQVQLIVDATKYKHELVEEYNI